jgi:hypothetical protein
MRVRSRDYNADGKPLISLVFGVLLAVAAAAPAAADVTDRLVRTLPLSPDTPVTLQVTVGEVKVIGWNRPELNVEIVRRAPDAAGLGRFPAQVDATPTGIVIRAVQLDSGREAALRSDVVLRLPATAALESVEVFEGDVELSQLSGACTAHVERGAITARDIAGTIRLETGMGDIRLERAFLSPDGLLRVRTFNGDVSVGLAARPEHARILALAMAGTITSDIPLNRKERWGPRWGEATLGNGAPVLSIDVVNGNIAIRVSK